MGISVYQIVTDRIVAKLKEGVVPWRKPWIRNGLRAPINYVTRKPYRGINQFLLEPGEYASFKQIEKAGGKVKKGSKSQVVVFWKPLEVDSKTEPGKKEKIFMLRYYNVFNIATDCEGLKSKIKDAPEDFTHDPHEEAEAIIQKYIEYDDLSFSPNGDSAYYRPSTDSVVVPPLSAYPNGDEYYSVAFHELVHATGAAKRLNRPGITESHGFGSKGYAREELVAEMGAAMLCAITGIDNSTIDNSAAYIQSWLQKLSNDVQLVVVAASQAQKAVTRIYPEAEAVEETEEAEPEAVAV